MREKKTRSGPLGDSVAAAEHAAYFARVEEACARASERVARRVAALGSLPDDKAQGFYAEVHHAETFNLDVVVNRMRHVAELPASNGLRSPDVVVRDGDRVVDTVSSKSYGTAKQSVDAQKGYGDQTRLVPKGQAADGKRYATTKAVKDRATGRPNRKANADALDEVGDRLTDHLSARRGLKRAESTPLGRKEAETELRAARRGEPPPLEPVYDVQSVLSESARAGATAVAATVAAAVLRQAAEEVRVRIELGEFEEGALGRLADGALDGAAESGLRSAVAASITGAAKAGWLGTAAAQHVDPGVVGTLTFLAFEGVAEYKRYSSGEVAGDAFADIMMQKSAVAAGAMKGAAIGQVMIPIPLLGAMIGGAVGQFAATHGYAALDRGVELHFRSDELERLAATYESMTAAWNDLSASYERWAAANARYEAEKARGLATHRALQAEHDDLDAALRRALDDDA